MVRLLTALALTANISYANGDLDSLVQAVRTLKPSVSTVGATSIALGAYAAAKRYQIDPYLLISIAFQESSFRQGLPKGPAGELGICQVISSWASNRAFRREFGKVEDKDFLIPSNSFKYAAWILHTVRKERGEGNELPSWTFYNGYAKPARQRYYKKVFTHLVAINGGVMR